MVPCCSVLLFHCPIQGVIFIQLRLNSESPPVWKRAAYSVNHMSFVCINLFVTINPCGSMCRVKNITVTVPEVAFLNFQVNE